MHLGIVSDTHDDLDVVHAAVDLFSGRVDAVIHCGDVISPFAATPFDADFDFYAARGNNDGEWALQSTIDEFGTYLGEFGAFEFGDVTVAVYHGTALELVEALVEAGTYDYVVHGHTHQRAHEGQDGTVRLNPGGVAITADAEGDPPAGIVLDTDTGAVAFHDLR